MLPKGKIPKNAHHVWNPCFFNSDSLFKIASYLSVEGLLNLALTTCRRFGIAPLPNSDGDNSLSLVDEILLVE